MKQSVQTSQGQIEQPPTEAAAHHAKPFLEATDAQKASNLSRLASWLPSRGNALFTLLVAGLLIMTQSVWSINQTPSATSSSTMSFQGRLTSASGDPLTGEYNMLFRIYEEPTGGTHLWEESWTGDNSVEVSDGLLNVMLGKINPTLTSAIAGHDDLYLGITVGADDEMSPRVPLASVPFAMHASQASDADTVDGLHASDLTTSSHTHNSLSAQDGDPADALVVDDEGKVGIGTTIPTSDLHIFTNNADRTQREELQRWQWESNSNAQIDIFGDSHSSRAGWWQLGAWHTDVGLAFITDVLANVEAGTSTKGLFIKDGNVGIGTTIPSKKLYVNGSAGGTQSWNASDVRWKKNIQPIPNALKKLSQIRGVSYNWKNASEDESTGFDKRTHFGVIAQEVETVFPELVDHLGQTDEYKHVEYNGLVGILIEATKELAIQNEELAIQNEELQNKIEEQQRQIEQLQKKLKE